MRVLSESEARRYVEQEVRRLPETVLNMLAQSGGVGRGRLIRSIFRSLPKSLEMEQVVEWVETILSYLIVRGDVERGAGEVYVSLPPYAVELLADDASEARYIRLHGDARGDGRVLEALCVLDPSAHISHSRSDVYTSDREERDVERVDADDPEPDLSLIDRVLCLDSVAATRHEEVFEIMEGCGYRLFRLDELASNLPSIHGLLCPPEHDLKDALEIGGDWEAYAPSKDGREAWAQVVTWHEISHSLVRKRGRRIEPGEGDRSFYHGGGGRVSELGWEEAALWLHYLNWMEVQEEFTVYKRGTLYVPNNLTLSMMRWLEMVVGRRLRRTRGQRRLTLPEGVAGYVQRIMEEKLGVRTRRNFPRSGGSGGRGVRGSGYGRYGR